jgi:hypothetical protein
MKTKGTLFQICLLGAVLSTMPTAAQVPFSWTTNSGAITITGYSGTNGVITIPDIITGLPVTSIEAQAFYGNRVMTNVMTGTNLTSIGEEAFQLCANLTNIIIGTNVTSIGVQAFFDCGKLAGVTIPASVAGIGQYAFAGCTSLTAIPVAPSNPNFSSVGGVIFNENQTTLFVYPGGLAGAYAIPASVTTIGTAAFDDCINLTGITFPSSVITIQEDAFAFCRDLTNVVIGSGVTTIANDVFDDSHNLTSITIPAGVTFISEPFCYGCTKLTNIAVSASNPDFISAGGVLFNQGQTSLLEYPAGLAGAYMVTNSVTSIADEAFGGCPGLTTVYIPASVSSLGEAVFESCSSLASAYFQGNAPATGTEEFLDANAAGKVCYFAGRTGWGTTFGGSPGGLPTVMLNSPLIINPGMGVQNNEFGFSIIGTNGQVFVVGACTNLVNANWQPIQTNTLAAALFNFTDLQWTNYPMRFYRIGPVP